MGQNLCEFSSNEYVVAIVEDDDDLRLNTALFLESRGFRVWSVASAEEFYRRLVADHADLILVDLGLPGEDGLSLVKHLHSLNRYSIIVMTARGGLDDRIAGLEQGADYYFVKPVDLYELTAGILAVLRKKKPSLPLDDVLVPSPVWALNRSEGVLITPTRIAIDLTSHELTLLEHLMNAAEKVFLKTDLLELFWPGSPEADFHRIEVLVSRLRAKVTKVSGLRLPVRSVFGRGMAFIGTPEVHH